MLLFLAKTIKKHEQGQVSSEKEQSSSRFNTKVGS